MVCSFNRLLVCAYIVGERVTSEGNDSTIFDMRDDG